MSPMRKLWMGLQRWGIAGLVMALSGVAGSAPARAAALWVTDYGTSKVVRVGVDGSGLAGVLAGRPNLRGVAVDAEHGKLYWLEAGPNAIWRANLDGSGIETVLDGLASSPYELALDPSGGKVYWTDYTGTVAIRRANLDGSGVEDLVLSGLAQPAGIALDLAAGKMLWADYVLGTISRANLDGSAVETLLTGLSQPRNLAIDRAAGVFYFTWGLGWGGVSRANLDGTGLTPIVTEGGNATGLALDAVAGRLYWADDLSGAVRSATKTGSDLVTVTGDLTRALGLALEPDPQTLLYVTDYGTSTVARVGVDGSGLAGVLAGRPNLRGVAVDALHGKLYWLEAGPNAMWRANLDGSAVESVATDLVGAPYELAIDGAGGKVYWTEYYGTVAIRRVNLDGSGVEDLVLSGLAQPAGIALDLAAGKMLWADYVLGTISRANLDGSAVETLLTGLSQPRNLAIDRAAGVFYFTWGLGWGGVSRANLDGTGLTPIVTEGGNATGLALDAVAGRLYWADDLSGAVRSATTTGSDLVTVTGDLTRALGLALLGAAGPPPPVEGVRLVDSAGAGLAGGVVSVYRGGWQVYGVTGPDGIAAGDLPDGTYTFRIQYAGGSIQKSQDIAVDPLVVFQTRHVVVQLKDSAGNPLDPGSAEYYASGWKPFGATVGGEVRKELLPASYTFAMSHAGGRVQKAQDVGANPLVVFQTRDVVVQLKDSAGNPLDPGSAEYYASGWKPFGATAGGEVRKELLPASYTFAMSFAGGRVQKAQDVGANPVVVFQTRDVVVQLKDSAGNPLDPGSAEYYASGWKPFGATAGGEVRKELLPASYTFAMSFAGGRVQKAQDVGANPVVVFETGSVVSDSATCTGYYAGSWRSFTQGMELLPSSYTFRFSTGLPAQQTFAIAAGMENRIR